MTCGKCKRPILLGPFSIYFFGHVESATIIDGKVANIIELDDDSDVRVRCGDCRKEPFE